MALQKFRDKQKLIYWIVAIIVIPSFMVLGYMQVFDYNPEKATVGAVDNNAYSMQEFTDFYQRIKGVNFGQPVYFTVDNRQPTFPEKTGIFLALAMRDKAISHGLEVTDDEVATYIKGQFGYEGNDPKELENMINNALESMTTLKSVYEYKLGVREWLLVKKYLNLIDNSVFVPETLADIINAKENTIYRYGKLEIPAADFTAEATKEIKDLSADKLNAEAEAFIAAHQNATDRTLYPFLWTDPKWIIEYISVPFVVEGLEPEVTDEDIQAFYNDNKEKYKDKDGKQIELADTKEQVKNDYIRGFRAQTANLTLGNEYDRFLHRIVLKGDSTDNKVKKIELSDINNDARLKERGLTAGVANENPVTAFEIADNKLFTGSGIQYMLAVLDRQFRAAAEADKLAGNNEETTKLYDEYSRSFRGFVMGGKEIVFNSSDDLFKIRLVKYVPGVARTLDNDEDLLTSITEAIIENKANLKAEDAAEAAKADLKANKREIAGREVISEESSYNSIHGKLQELRGVKIGETVGPFVSDDSTGYAVYVLYGKDINKQIDNEEIAATPMNVTIGWRGNSIYTPAFFMQSSIKIGHRLASYIFVEIRNGNIVFNDELLR